MMTRPDFHFVAPNSGVALPLGEVKASVPIHTVVRVSQETSMEQAGCDRLRDNQMISYSWAADPLEALYKNRRPASIKRERKELRGTNAAP
jgi:hypothetical protein